MLFSFYPQRLRADFRKVEFEIRKLFTDQELNSLA